MVEYFSIESIGTALFKAVSSVDVKSYIDLLCELFIL